MDNKISLFQEISAKLATLHSESTASFLFAKYLNLIITFSGS